MHKRTFASLIVLLIGVLSVTLATAQSFRGGITGTVTDANGAAIPSAEITVVDQGTGASRAVTTDAQGNYAVPELPLGNYTITAKSPGFAGETVRNVVVSVSTTTTANITLRVGQVSQSVEVTASAPLIEATTDNLGGTIEGEQAEQLPLNGGDFTRLLLLVPGSTGDPVGSTDSPGSFGLFSANGARGRSNNYLLDGTDMNDGYRNLPSINEAGVFGEPAVVLPIDSIAEVPIISGAEAEYGRNAGAIVNIVTKSGTNNVHGSAYEYFRNNALDARNYFDSVGTRQDALHNNQFGATLGGPIVKDRTFYFVSYEGQRESFALPSLATVPTASDIAAAGGVSNPVIAALLARNPWPAANIPTNANGFNFETSTPGYQRANMFIAKIDQHLFANDTFTGRYFFGDSDQSFPFGLLGGNVLPGYNTVTPTRAQVLSLSYTHVISPRLLVEVRGGWNRFAQQFQPEDRSFNPSSIGLVTVAGQQDTGLPLISVSGYTSIGANAGDPRGRADTNWQYFTNVSYSTGAHDFKYGYEFRRTSVNQFFDEGHRGKLVFNSLADFLSGTIDGGSAATGDSRRHTYENNDALYLQDSWKLSRKLTVNYGLRWDYFGVIGEKNGLFSIFNPTSGPQLVKQLYPRDLNNFAPRLSFAYDLSGSGRTVVRGGIGVYYDAFSQDFFAGQIPYNTINPGPAYNGIGPAPILFTSSPSSTLVAGSPVFSNSSFSASDVFTVAQNLRTPYYDVYNLNLEHEITKQIAGQVAYVGSLGRKLFRFRDINQVTDPVTGARPYPAYGYINQVETSASSSYNSLQTSLKLKSTKHVNATLNYTWSHSIDDASDGQDYVPQAAQPDNSYNPKREFASSNFDTRNRVTAFVTYDLSTPNFMPRVLGGWTIGGIFTHQTGMPYNPVYLFEGDFNGSGEYFGRPDVVGNPYVGKSTPTQLLNLSAFAVPCTYDAPSGACVPGTQHFGNMRRNAFNGPAYTNFDLNIAKNMAFGDRVRVTLRIDAFNALNHPNFSNPTLPSFAVDFLQNGISPNGTGVGYLSSTATPDVGTGNPFLGGGGPRDLQLSLRFTF